MKARFRFFAALSALVPLVLLQAEGLWASSACSAAMEMAEAMQMADADSHAAGCPMESSGHSHERDGQDSRDPGCPLMPAGAASCTGAVALLPSTDAPAAGARDYGRVAASPEHAKDLLLAMSLLRPPRA